MRIRVFLFSFLVAALGLLTSRLTVVARSPTEWERGLLTTEVTFGLLFSLLIAALAAELLSRKLARLTAFAARINAGELDLDADLERDNEWGEIGQALRFLVTRLSTTMRELSSERHRLERVVSSMQEGVLVLDRHGAIQLVNGAAREMLGFGPNATGKAANDMLNELRLKELFGQALAGKSGSDELKLSRPKTRQVLASVRRLYDKSGAIAVLVDLTEQRRLETMRQEFVANASHELRTPTAAILSAAETLLTAAASDPESSRDFVQMIIRNAERLRNLINDLLALSRLESSELGSEIEQCRLLPLAELTLDSLVPAARDKETELMCYVPSTLVAMADADGLEHALANLVDNAIKYCPRGARVTLRGERRGDRAFLTVSDNGPGIPREHQSRIFERFYRVDAGRSRGLGGTGLGLSIVKHWVEAMNGSIRVYDAADGGAAFEIGLEIPSEVRARESSPVADSSLTPGVRGSAE